MLLYKKHFYGCLVTFCLLAYSTNVFSDEIPEMFSLTLEELIQIKVKTATKTEETSGSSPAVVSIITADDIRNYGFNTVAEALSHVAGFVDNYDLAIHNFGVRGINSGARSGSRTIKFMIDSQPIAFRPNSQNFLDKELIAVDLIERIEIVRGPVSVLYGANAFLGVVNIVTKTVSRLSEANGQLSLQWNSIDAAQGGYTLSATHALKSKKWDYSVGLSRSKVERDGISLPRSSPAYSNTDVQQSADDKTEPFSLYGRFGYHLDDKSNLKVSLFYQQINTGNPFSDINYLETEGASHIALDNGYLRADYNTELAQNISAHVSFAYSEGGTLDDDRVEVGAENFFLKRHFGYDGLDFGAELFFSFDQEDSLLIGFDTQQDQHDIESFTRVERQSNLATQINPDLNKKISNKGVYFQYLKQLSKNWRAVLGYRADDNSVTGSQASARLGVVAQLPDNTILKVLGGSSFQAASPELLYRTAVQSGDIIGNPLLLPQKAKTLEISVSKPLVDVLHMTATYFNTRVEDLVIFESDSSNLFATNSSGSRTKGYEFEMRLVWQDINAFYNYSLQETHRQNNSFNLFILEQRPSGEIYPEKSANFGVNYYWKDKSVNFSLSNRWVGDRLASSSNVLYANQFYQLNGYSDTTLTISTNRFSLVNDAKANLRFQVKDLFDSGYVNPGFGGIEYPSLGRQYLISFEQRF